MTNTPPTGPWYRHGNEYLTADELCAVLAAAEAMLACAPDTETGEAIDLLRSGCEKFERGMEAAVARSKEFGRADTSATDEAVRRLVRAADTLLFLSKPAEGVWSGHVIVSRRVWTELRLSAENPALARYRDGKD